MENASESMAVFRILMREKEAEVRLQVLSDNIPELPILHLS
jgi:hypothetical protein